MTETAIIIGLIGLTALFLVAQNILKKENEYFKILYYFVFLGFTTVTLEFIRELVENNATLSGLENSIVSIYWVVILLIIISVLFFMFKMLIWVWEWLNNEGKKAGKKKK